MTATSPLIELADVWRRYRVAPEGRPQTLRGSLALGRAGTRREWRWALQAVDLRLRRGEAVAIIGPNGAGKSTLLRIAGGVGRPDRGRIRREGRTAALLDLGRELHPDLTGRQNAELAAVVAGLSRREFRERFDAILEFAELRGFEDEPLHAYSDGMRARLAFSVLVHVDPEVLLVDEVLAVGDAAFQRRSVDRIEAARSAGAGVLFVSHDLGLVRAVCDTAIWLDRGRVRRVGPAAEVTMAYLEETLSASRTTDAAAPSALGAPGDLDLRDAWGAPVTGVRVGDGLSVRWALGPAASADPVEVSVVLQREGADALSIDTSTTARAGDACRVDFERLDLAPGRYDVVVSVHEEGWRRQLGQAVASLEVHGEGPERALLAPPHRWSRRAPGDDVGAGG